MNKAKLIKELEAASATAKTVADRAKLRLLTEELDTAEEWELTEIMYRHMDTVSLNHMSITKLNRTDTGGQTPIKITPKKQPTA